MKSTEALIPAFWSGFGACLAMVTLLHAGGSLYFPLLGCVALIMSPLMLWAARRILLDASATADSRPLAASTSESVEGTNG